jgi:adenylosuccinate lyase
MTIDEQLFAVTPIDGRYSAVTEVLREITSEFGLIRYRAQVELAWLGALGSGMLPDVRPLNSRAKTALSRVEKDFSLADARRIKEIDRKINHDVKAVELWLREKLSAQPGFKDYLALIHFGCTSDDINNLAYALMIRDARDQVILTAIGDVIADLSQKAIKYADLPMLARTHGQPATPTTLGKEMAVFAGRLVGHKDALSKVTILGKWNGATGNYNAATIAYPDLKEDWPIISKRFVESLGLTFNDLTTQIEPHDWIARFCNELALGNTIMTDLARDTWSYISLGYFKLSVVGEEVGSSTMPHKVNPIDFEKAEANFGLANAVLTHLAQKLPISRLQRDLSDTSALRALGEGIGHSRIAASSLKIGLSKIVADEVRIATDIDEVWEVLTEAVQTVLRRYGVADAYEIIKRASRGRTLDQAAYHKLVKSLAMLPSEAVDSLLNLTPAQYIGRAADLAKSAKLRQ